MTASPARPARGVPGASVAEFRAVDFEPNYLFLWRNEKRPDESYDQAVAACDKVRDPLSEERAEATQAALRDGWEALFR